MTRARRSYRSRTIATAAGTDLPADALREIDQLATRSVLHAAARIARHALRRGNPLDAFSTHLVSIARSIDSILAAHGSAVPLYLFGHSHRPAMVEMRPESRALYANAGTWASLRPARIGRLIGPGRYPFLRIGEGPAGALPDVRLALWNVRALAQEPYPEPDLAAVRR